MNRISLGCASLLVLGCALPGIRPVHAAAACASLAQELKLPHTTITLATEVPAGAFKLPTGAGAGGPGANFGALPAFCRVAGTARPTADSDIRFEVWMPLSGWNGKFVGAAMGSGPAPSPMATWSHPWHGATRRRLPMWDIREVPWMAPSWSVIRRS